MTPPHGFDSTPLHLIPCHRADEDVLRLEVHGFLDFDSSEAFLTAVTAHLADTPAYAPCTWTAAAWAASTPWAWPCC